MKLASGLLFALLLGCSGAEFSQGANAGGSSAGPDQATAGASGALPAPTAGVGGMAAVQPFPTAGGSSAEADAGANPLPPQEMSPLPAPEMIERCPDVSPCAAELGHCGNTNEGQSYVDACVRRCAPDTGQTCPLLGGFEVTCLAVYGELAESPDWCRCLCQ